MLCIQLFNVSAGASESPQGLVTFLHYNGLMYVELFAFLLRNVWDGITHHLYNTSAPTPQFY